MDRSGEVALALEDGCGSVSAESDTLGHSNLSIWDLPRTTLAPELPSDFTNLEQALSRGGFPEAEKATGWVDGHATGRQRFTRMQQVFGFAGLAQAPLFWKSQLVVDRIVLKFYEVEILGTNSCGLKSLRDADSRFAVVGRPSPGTQARPRGRPSSKRAVATAVEAAQMG